MRADLHCHSTCSDGSLTVTEILNLAEKKELQGLAITDHDSIEAYPQAIELGKEKGIQVISGVEFSSHYKQKSVHILGYSFDFTNPAILNLCKKHIERRKTRNLAILQKLKQEGFSIEEEELYSIATHAIGRPHIAHIMIQKGYVQDLPSAFKKYLGDGKKCYVAGDFFSVEETIEAIKKSGGIAILAHPHLYQSKKFVINVIKAGLDGIEGYYANMGNPENFPWIRLGEEMNLLITGGSDFHGIPKPAIALGASLTPWETFEKLYARFHASHS